MKQLMFQIHDIYQGGLMGGEEMVGPVSGCPVLQLPGLWPTF